MTYLVAIATEQFQLASDDGTAGNPVIYQNLGWTLISGTAPTGF